MNFLLRILSITAFLLVGGSISAQAEQRTSNLYWAPPNITVGGEKIDMLLNFIFVLTLVVFVLTQGVYIIYLIRYRRRPGHKAHYSHGNNIHSIDIHTLFIRA
jgi:cytochrome c oxidase subunit 2